MSAVKLSVCAPVLDVTSLSQLRDRLISKFSTMRATRTALLTSNAGVLAHLTRVPTELSRPSQAMAAGMLRRIASWLRDHSQKATEDAGELELAVKCVAVFNLI